MSRPPVNAAVADINGSPASYRDRSPITRRCAMREYILTQAQSLERIHSFPTLRRILRNWRMRRSLRKLEDLDDHMLMDIGLARAELMRVQGLPLDIDP